MRLDRALVARGLVTSRVRAARALAAGHVLVNRRVVTKAAHPVTAADQLAVTEPEPYVSRAAHKLCGALASFDIDHLEGLDAIDAGSSTGGFTQVLLERGVAHVTGFDVGHDQMHPSVRADPRVSQHDGVNLRQCPPCEPADIVVADLSFISLRYVLGTLARLMRARAHLIALVKPQFEVGKADLGPGGLVTDPALHARAIMQVAAAAAQQGLVITDLAPSVLPGASGNREFFLLARPGMSTPAVVPSHLGAQVDRLVTVTKDAL